MIPIAKRLKSPKPCWKCKTHTTLLFTWAICSDVGDKKICERCDLALNKLALKWAYPKNWKAKYKAYEESLR